MKTFTIFMVAFITSVLKDCGLNLNQYKFKKRGLKLIQIILIVGFIPLFNACYNVYFSTPQPVDSKNIYRFPREYRGMWICERDSIIIGKDYFKYIKSSEWFVSKLKADTSSSYVLEDNKIYVIDTTQGIIGRFPYKLDNDTIYYQENEGLEIDLGKKAFLRRIKKNYILNIKEENQWWTLILINKDKIGKIIIASFEIEDLEKYTKYKNIYTYKEKYSRSDYINATWRKKELLEMINKGLFSDTIMKLKLNKSFCEGN